jgi:hypothetical protein
MQWFRRHYGAGPLHLVGLLVCIALAALAATKVIGAGGWKAIFLWFIFCVILHDFIGWPIYTVADRLALRTQRRTSGTAPRVPWINHVRAPTIISGLLLVMFFPLIFRLSNATYEPTTGFNENIYLLNWLMVSAILFGTSAIIYAVRLVMTTRRSQTDP